MKCKMIFLAVGAALLFSACNEHKVEAKADVKPAAEVQAAPAEVKPAPKPASSAIAEKISMIEWKDALEMGAKGAVFVDVRNPNELRDGFVQGSINIPLPELKQRFAELPKDKDILVYCRSGRRSELATHFLMQQGYEKAHNILGGFMAYPRD
ncbi:MAG: rhodanese-like domain-containing protein [Fibrobacter sp.]|nr:rhodanese-like domain-containing protein [Fibrobacter sp.]